MKKFYTFEPKNFRIFSKMKSFLAVALLLLMAVGIVNAQTSAKRVINPSTLSDGDQIVIVATNLNKALSTQFGTTSTGTYGLSVDVNGDLVDEWIDSIYWNETDNVQIITMGIVGGDYTLKVGDEYLCWVSGNTLAKQTELNDNSKWTFTSQGAIANKNNSSRRLQYNASSPRFACYTSDQKPVTIYKVVVPEVVCEEYVTRTDNVSLCESKNGNTNQYYDFYGKNLNVSDAGTHLDTVPGIGGACDTIVTLNLSVIDYYYETEHQMFEGDTWEWHGTTITDSGWVYTEYTPAETACGCDSFVYAHVTFIPVNSTFELVDEACIGSTYTFPLFDGRDTNIICTETYYIVEETKVGVAVGNHDSTRVLYLDVYPTYNETATDAICQGTEYQFGEGIHGYHFDTDAEPGVYTNLVYTFQSVHGCDSTVTLTLTINPVYNNTVEATFCENQLPQNIGDSIVIEAGKASGEYTYNLHTVEGCDSTITVLLTVNPVYTENITETICASRLPYDFRGHEWTEAGSQTYNETTVAGCDSIVNFTLVVNPVYNETLYDTICPSELAAYEFRGHNFTEGGVYTYEETTAENCDSIVVFNLTVIPVFNREELDTTICVNEAPFVYYGQNCDTTGTYIVPVNACGDTTATLRLTVNETNACTFTVAIEAGENGTITGATTVNHGEDYDYVITPNSCYYIESIMLDGAAQTIEDKDGMTLTLDSVYTNHTIAVTFAMYQYNVTATGTVEASAVYNCGEETTYTFVADPGYHIDSLYIDGELETAATDETWTNGSKVFTMTADHSIAVFYSKSHYTISASVTGIGGTIEPVGDSIYEFDAFPTYTFTMEDCIGVRTVKIDDEEVEVTGDSYTFDTLTHNMTIEVVFDTVIYELRSVFHGPGTGTFNGYPEGVFATAACGSTVTGHYYVDADAATHSQVDSVRWAEFEAGLPSEHFEFFLNPITMDGTNNVVDVYFSRESHHLYTHVNAGNGEVLPTDSVVYYTDSVVVVATADHGWHVATITCGDETWTGQNGTADSIVTFTVQSVTSDTNVYVTFEINNYTITINTYGDGTTTPAGPDSITQYGSNFELTATPGSCTYLDSIVVDGEIVTDVNLTNIDNDHVIDVYFTVKQLTMTGSGEHVTVTGTGTVLCGSDYVYTITADTLYHVDSVYVNGEFAESYTGEQREVTHTVTNVTENSVLTAYASLNHVTVTAMAEEGTITPESAQVTYGEDQTFVVVPNDCYQVSGITVNGEEYDLSQLSAPTGASLELLNEDFESSVFSSTETNYCGASGAKVTSYSNWTNLTEVYKSEGKIKMGTASKLGYFEIPVDLSNGTYNITFDAMAWSNDSTTIKVIVDGETHLVSGLDNSGNCSGMSSFSITGSNGSSNAVVRFEGKQANKGRFYIDNIVITKTVEQQTFTVTNITDPTTVNVTFIMDTFQMTHTVTGEGTVNNVAAADSAVACGTDFNYVMEAAEGYHVVSYTLDGVTTAIDNSENQVSTYTLAVPSVHADHVFAADFAINTYKVTAHIEHQAGSYDPATPQVVNHGDSAVITFTADAATGYHIEKIICGEDTVTLDSNAAVTYVYKVNEVVSDTDVYVYFKHNIFPITVIFDETAGDVAPVTQNWEYGEDATYQITPNSCKYIDTILLDNVSVPVADVTGMPYTIPSVDAAHTLEVIFADSMYTMSGMAMNEHGTINSGEAVCGGNFIYHIDAEEGYHINWVMINGENDPEYTDLYIDTIDIEFTDIHTDYDVKANFEIDYYDITISSVGAGTVTPVGDSTHIIYNTPIAFTFAPESCQELVSFTIDGDEYIDSVENNAYTWHANTSGDIIATFDTIVYTMAETHTGEGTVNNGEVKCGEDYTYIIAASEGYHIESYTIVGGVTTTRGNNDDINDTLVIEGAYTDTTLSVVFAINTYTVDVCTGVIGGSLTASATTVNFGDTCEVTIVANAADGYHIDTIKCGDEVVEVFGVNDSITYVYAINGITSDTSICATFSMNTYLISASVTDAENIEIVPGDSTVTFGDTVVYTIRTLNDCHYISTIIIDEDTLVHNDSIAYVRAFNDIRANHKIVANAEIYTYIANTSVNDDNFGEITATDTIDCGDDFQFTVTPAHGYHIDSVTVDDIAQVVEDSTTFSGTIPAIHADVNIVAYFGINHYTIASSSGDNGTISPEDTIVYEYGETPAYTITPDPCYYISEVLVDDQPVEITDSIGMTYTFEALEAAHTIVANFAIYQYAMTAEYDDWMGNVTTEEAQDCGTDYQYIITANTGYHIVSYTIGGVETTNTMDEPNDFVTDTITISPVSQDTNLVVVFDTNTYTVSVCAGIEGGTVVVNEPVEVNYNEGTTVTVTADSANGYHIATITDDRGGNDVELGENTNTIYTYSVDNVTEDIVVCATFELNTFKITATAGENGTITPEGDTIVTYGDIIDFVIEPNHTCYYISDVVVDGESVWVDYTDSVSAYTYTFNVSEFDPAEVEHTISAEYTIFEYTMASNAYTEGTVSSATVNCGTDYDYEIEANYGYHIDHVVLDGVTTAYEGQETTATITVTDVQADHQLDVYFTINHYTVTATAGEHGSIEVAGVTTVAHGEELTYTITPDHCYYIEEVLVNDEAVEFTTGDSTGATYTFASVEDTMTIHANFHIYEYAMTASYDETMGTVEEGIANCGSNFTYNVHANEGYHIVSIQVGSMIHNHYGLNEDTEATFNVYNVSQDTICYVEFAANTYTVNFNVTGEGTVDPESATVTYDSTLAYTATAAEGYHIVSITDNGTEVYTNDDRDINTYEGTIDNIRENHTVEVVFAINQYTITATAGAEGQIVMPGENTVNYGQNINFTIRATEPCYYISNILVDGEVDTTFTNNETLYTYTFNNVDADHTIEAQFDVRTYTVVLTASEGGTVDPSDDTTTFNCGDNATYTFTPDEGYEVVSVTVNGQNLGAQATYTISNIQNDYTIDVVFGQITYTLTSSVFGHGTIEPMGDTIVAVGATVAYTLTPDDCYTVSNILVNGVSYLNNDAFDGTTLTIEDVQSDMTVQAYFQIMKYTVTTEAAEGGVITETALYNCGTDVVIAITPDACYNIDSVVVDGVDQGEVTEVTFDAIDADHTVNAYFSMKTYVITASVNDEEAGTITETDTFNCGEAPTYEITANEGYHIVSVEVDGQDQGAIESYTFASLHEDHTIVANFEINTYTLTVNANAGVGIEPVAGDTVVEYGATVTYNFTVDSCYEIADVMLDGESIGAVESYTFDSVDDNHVLMVSTTMKTYTITASTNEGGTITPAGETTVTCNGTQSFSITAAAGYYVDDVLVDGESVGVVNNYVFSGVTEDHTIEVVFAANDSLTYTITATAGENGTITPEGDTTVNHGTSITYVITPDEYYTIDQVIVDGNVLPTPVPTYTFSNITADHTIEVTFVADQMGCVAPGIVYTTNITETSATLNWNDTEAASYTIRYKKLSDSTYTVVDGITDVTYDLTGLDEATEYVWSVKSVCVADEAESAWSVSVTFVTEETIDTTGIHNAEMSAINVYSYGNDIYVTNESNEQIKDVQVYDMNGRMIHRGMVQNNPEVINVTAANGIYIVRVVTETSVRNFKVSITQR